MITKKVNRYYCEFCKKSGGSSGHIRRHEEHCTRNPNRKCRMCLLDDNFPQPKMKDLLVLLPDPKEYELEEEYGMVYYSIAFVPKVNEAIEKIREITTCPACIMSALRQKGIPVPCAESFNYKKEVEELFYQRNQDQLEKNYGY